MSKSKEEVRPAVLLGRPSNNVSIGIVGMPNIGKSLPTHTQAQPAPSPHNTLPSPSPPPHSTPSRPSSVRCWARGTLLYRADGQLVRVEHVKEGDRLLGDDGGVRRVQAGSVNSGTAPLVDFVATAEGDWGNSSFRVNREHVLVLSQHAQPTRVEGGWEVRDLSLPQSPVQAFPDEETCAKWCGLQRRQLIEMTVRDFLALPVGQQRELHCVRAAAVTAADRTEETPLQAALAAIDNHTALTAEDAAYLLGAWLAAGSHAVVQGELFSSSARWAALQSAGVDVNALAESLSHSLHLSTQRVDLSLWLLHSVSTRLRLLAGFVDQAGVQLSAGNHRVSSTQLDLLQSLHTLALSVGLHVHSRTATATGEYSMTLTGDLHSAATTFSTTLPSYSFEAVEVGSAEYFGFTVDGNSRLLLSDLTVTHNSSLFNCLSNLSVPAENYPFCTIDPSTARVAVPDERFDYLCSTFKPASKVPAVLTITDIAGLVKGANEGKGLGNAFLSHIQAVDAIYHLVRAFKDKEIEHVEGSVDPIRDLDIIAEELILKDASRVHDRLEVVKRMLDRGQDKVRLQRHASPPSPPRHVHTPLSLSPLCRCVCVSTDKEAGCGDVDHRRSAAGGEEGHSLVQVVRQHLHTDIHTRIHTLLCTDCSLLLFCSAACDVCRKPDDIDVLNELQLLTAKPVVYLVNIGEDEYYQQKNKCAPHSTHTRTRPALPPLTPCISHTLHPFPTACLHSAAG